MTCTQESFLKDVSKHEITVIRDHNESRHIRFKRPGDSSYYFDLITWPGYLCFTGDMGTYVFSRLDDMFQFFRSDNGKINRQYWSEKLKAVDCSGANKGSAVEFSENRFTQVINGYRVRWIRDAKAYGSLDKEQRRELWQAVDDDVLSRVNDGEHAAFDAAYQFSWGVNERHPTYTFEDLFEHRFEDYTYHFTWCCYALAWGIAKYDKHKEA